MRLGVSRQLGKVTQLYKMVVELGLSQFQVPSMAWFIVLPPSVACKASGLQGPWNLGLLDSLKSS